MTLHNSVSFNGVALFCVPRIHFSSPTPPEPHLSHTTMRHPRRLHSAFILLFSTVGPVLWLSAAAFAPTLVAPGHRRSVRQWSQHREEDGSGNHDESQARARLDRRVDVRNLLTQRAIQSFLFLLDQCRDPHSGKWIEDFLQTQNQLEFHGTGAGYLERFGGHWSGPLVEIIQQPPDVVIVSAKRRGRGHGGWSKDNPFLEDRYVEFEIDIDPVSLASRILSVREQISKEWITDLDVLDAANRQIIDSYFGRVKAARPTQYAFERTATNILNNHTAFATEASSPFRKGSFDLLYNLCTQAAVHRLLREYAEGGRRMEVPLAWLRKFYTTRVAAYFDGDQPYGRADDFLDELLRTSPSVLTAQDGKPALADPLLLAEEIIRTRSIVAQEWKALMKHVPEDHTDIRKLILSKQVEKWSSGQPMGGFE